MERAPSTNATRLLKQRGLAYTEHFYRYEERGGTRVSARELGVDEHAVIKTTSGRFWSSSITRVLMTACSSTPSSRADTRVPPRSS